ncbi:MAG: TIGR00730 family Rossman fold protein, partial [Alphaproteobacteria bacterium]
MATIRSVCVYCGSGSGHDPAYIKAATELGTTLAQAGMGLIYGGGGTGMMGAVAAAVLKGGGKVT